MPVVLAAGFGVVGVSGCGLQSAGMAAQVGDTVITVGQIEDQVRDYAEESGANLSGDEAARVTRALLERQIAMELYDQVAAELDVTVSESEVADALRTARREVNRLSEEQYQQVVRQNFLTKAMLEDTVRWLVVREALVTEIVGSEEPESQEQADELQTQFTKELTAAAVRAGADVRVNPRFGSWDDESGTLRADGNALVDLSDDQSRQELPPVLP